MTDTTNSPKRHGAVAIASIAVAGLLYLLGYDIQVIFAAIPYFLLFLTVIIGPLLVVWPPLRRRFRGNFPVNWRSELGIWFVIWAIAHVVLVVDARSIEILWSSPWAFGALIATLLAFALLFTSNTRAFNYMGAKAWKWHQSHATYLIFYLLASHIWHRAYIIPGFPSDEPLHWVYLIMFALVVVLHVGGFIKVIRHYNRTGEYPPQLR